MVETEDSGARKRPSGTQWAIPEPANDVLPWLSAVQPSFRASLAAASTLKPYRADAMVFELGASPRAFHFVVRGRVKLLLCKPAGEDVMIDYVLPGGLLCGNVVYRGRPYCCGAAFGPEGGSLLAFERERFLEVAHASPAVSRVLMDAITCRGSTVCKRLDEVGGGKSHQRIAKLLSRLAEDVGVGLPGGHTWIPVQLSRRELASMCGMRMETVIRIMTRLQRDEVVDTAASGFIVRDRAALQAVAESD